MKHDLKFDTFIARCRVAVETIAPQLIYTNTQHLDDEGRFSMDFVSIDCSDNHLLTVVFGIDPHLADYANVAPSWVAINTVSYFDDISKHNRTSLRVKNALEAEFERKYNFGDTHRDKRVSGIYLSTDLSLVS